MVLTRRQHKAISRWLPNEVIAEVMRAAPKPDQAALCRVSKLFHGLATPVVYRVVELKELSFLLKFSSVILSNPNLAGFIRSLTLSAIWPEADPNSSKLIFDSLRTLLALEHLAIPLDLLSDEHLDALLQQCIFPRLLSCGLGIREQRIDKLATFLAHHPALTSLELRDFLFGFQSSLSDIPAPSLQHIRCPVHLIPRIDTNNLKSVEIGWYLDDYSNDVEPIFVALKSMTHIDVPFACTIGGWSDAPFAEIVDSVSRNLPHTKLLRMQLFHIRSRNEKIAHLKNCLPRFTGLVFLSIEPVRAVANLGNASPAWESEADDRNTVRGLGDVCPTLEACCLNLCAWRKIDESWEKFSVKDLKFSVKDFRALAGIRRSPTDPEIDF